MTCDVAIAEIPPTTAEELAQLKPGIEKMMEAPQVEIKTKSFIHAGIYCRTCMVPKGVALAGALIKIPTVVTVSGDAAMTCAGKTVRLKGTHIFRASAGRRQIFVAYEDTVISMAFATSAKTLLEAEAEFTDETDLLMSRGE
jgi:hypothetical protein